MNYLDSIEDYFNPNYLNPVKRDKTIRYIEQGHGYNRYSDWYEVYIDYNRHHFYYTLKDAYNNKIKNYNELNKFIEELNKVADEPDPGYYYERYKARFIGETIDAIEFVIKECFSDELKQDPKAIKTLLSVSILGNYYYYEYGSDCYTNLATKYTLKDMETDKVMSPIEYAEFCIKNDVLRTSSYYYHADLRSKYKLYIPDEYKCNPDFLRVICNSNLEYIYKFYSYIEQVPGLIYELLDANASKGINIRKLPPEIREYILQNEELRTLYLDDAKDKVAWIEHNVNSDLYEKLRKRFGESFDKKHPDQKDDKFFFMYKMLSSNVLSKIYSDDYFTITDISFIQPFLNHIDKDEELKEKYPTKKIRSDIELLIRKNALISDEFFKAIVNNRQNEEAMKEIVGKLGYTKNNFFDKVKKHRYWDKSQKKEVLMALSQYFKTKTVITVYDIIDLLEEMEEKGLTKEEILKDHKIEPRFFDKLYNELRETNPELFELIKNKFHQNSLRGFKKLLMLYHAIMNSNITDAEEFLIRFKRTPEEAIMFFANTDFGQDIYKKITSWYTPETVGTGSGNKKL